jgi:hypothetical protein
MKKQLNVFVDESIISKLDDLVEAYQPREAVAPTRPLYLARLIEREHRRLIDQRLKNMPTLAEAEAANSLPAPVYPQKGE